MRRLFIVVSLGLAMSILARSPRSADAATIEGRVVDSAGKPLAGAEVRIWQHVRGPDGRLADRQVEFDGGGVLLTDAEGRFVSPDVLIAGAAQVVAEAGDIVAGHSFWVPIAQDAVAAKVPDITLKGLRVVIGQVLDRSGQPVDGATVFNSGDGHKRVEARSKSGGRFLLADVPKGAVFLFAEKPGYRFTGVRLPPDEAKATLVLTSVDEPAEPMATLPPLVSPEEEYALARDVLDPWLEQLAQTGTPQQRIFGFRALIQINGLEAFRRLDWLGDVDKITRDFNRDSAIRSIIAHRGRPSWEEVRAMIEASDDEYCTAADLIFGAHEMNAAELDAGEQAMCLEWLTSAAAHARNVDDPSRRVGLLAGVAEQLFSLREVARARQILAEAENDAKPLVPDGPAQLAFFRLSLAAAHDDADCAIDWLVKSGYYLQGGRLAVGLLPDRPQRANEVWRRVAEWLRKNPLRAAGGTEYRAAAEFCYRLARVDRPLAEQVAADADEAIQRYREKAGIVLAVAETQPAEARRLLAALVREELPQLLIVESRRLPWESAPAIAAWLLPVAEQVAPDLCGELFWRSLALRLPRPGRDDLSNQVELTDIELAKLLARYDRDIARALLESLGGNASASGNAPVLARILSAAVHVDPRWAKSLLDVVANSPSSSELSHRLRSSFMYTLALPLPDRWNADEAGSAGFWEPSAKDRGFPP